MFAILITLKTLLLGKTKGISWAGSLINYWILRDKMAVLSSYLIYLIWKSVKDNLAVASMESWIDSSTLSDGECMLITIMNNIKLLEIL